TASFTSSASSALNGVPITFTDTSSGNPTSWLWNFGDSTTSTLQNPSHSWVAPGSYTVSLTATNSYGASTPATTPISITADTTAPTTPGGLTATANGQTKIDLAWTASTDNVAVTGYGIYRDGAATPTATVGPGTLAYQDTPLAPASTHSYTVDAFDAAGNRSTPAGPASATTVGGSATITLSPVADSYVDSILTGSNNGSSTPLRVSGGLNNTSVLTSYLKFDLSGVAGTIQSATLTMTPASTGGVGFSIWRVGDSSWGETTITFANAPTRDATSSGSVPGPLTSGTPVSISIAGLAAGAQGGLLSVALTTTGSQESLASRESATPPTLTVVVGPGTPGVPTASFTSSASSALSGVPITFTDTSNGSPTSWLWDFGDGTASTLENPSHAWATAGTYTVSLTATNSYGSSTPATASISINADTNAPTTPGGLAATANGQTEIDLAWTASTDNLAVTGYGIYRDGAATPTATVGPGAVSYQDTSLAASSTHSYTVDAFDAAGNRSTPAGPVSATTAGGAVTIVLTPVADSYTNSLSATTNFGSATTVRVAGGVSGTAVLNSYLKFDLSGVVGTIESATISFTPTTTGGSGFSIWRVGDSSWAESTITWANQPLHDLTSAASVPGPLALGTTVSASITGLATGAQGGLLSIAMTTTGSQEALGSRLTGTPEKLTIVVSSP
ncbi:MAG TPA: PKD domain-containing protein, partial [Candidatus Limnocylindrales bacterium]